MALTIAKLSPNPDHVSGNVKFRYRKVTFDTSYPDGGEAIAASDFGLKKIYHLSVNGVLQKSDESLAFGVGWDDTASKLVVYEGDNDNAADAPFIEEDDTASLDGYYVVVHAVGI